MSKDDKRYLYPFVMTEKQYDSLFPILLSIEEKCNHKEECKRALYELILIAMLAGRHRKDGPKDE